MTTTVEQAARADVVFVATPVKQMPVIFALLSSRLGLRTVGDRRRQHQTGMSSRLRARRWAPLQPVRASASHCRHRAQLAPLAFPTLYESRKVVICAGAETRTDAVQR